MTIFSHLKWNKGTMRLRVVEQKDGKWNFITLGKKGEKLRSSHTIAIIHRAVLCNGEK